MKRLQTPSAAGAYQTMMVLLESLRPHHSVAKTMHEEFFQIFMLCFPMLGVLAFFALLDLQPLCAILQCASDCRTAKVWLAEPICTEPCQLRVC